MAKNPLKISLFALFFAAFTLNVHTADRGMNTGETSPNPEMRVYNSGESSNGKITNLYNYKKDNILVIAFMPDISNENVYAEVMTSAFQRYFTEGLGFTGVYDAVKMKEKLKVLVVSKNDESQVREFIENRNVSFDMVPDINMDAANSFAISSWSSNKESSSVYVIDENNRIVYADNNYKGEGEKLRSVQKEVFTQLEISDPAADIRINDKILMPGDIAADFEFTYIDPQKDTYFGIETFSAKLSDYIGKKNVIIAFYPAPFSMSCMMEARTFDAYAEKQTIKNITNSNIGSDDDVEILMVSNSGAALLFDWRKDLNLKNVKLISDNSGEISNLYSSFNPMGYNNRTLFIVDKTGKLSYIDWDYQVDDTDFSKVTDHLKLISEK